MSLLRLLCVVGLWSGCTLAPIGQCAFLCGAEGSCASGICREDGYCHVESDTTSCADDLGTIGTTPDAPPPSCSPPVIALPTAGESVGPSIDLTVSAPACIDSMIAYIDSEKAVTVHTNSISEWVAVTMGAHTLNVNAWTPKGDLYRTDHITFTRTY